MSYHVSEPIILGVSNTGLTLYAKLINRDDGLQQGSNISSGFTELAVGDYRFEYDSVPDGFYGYAQFYNSAGDIYLCQSEPIVPPVEKSVGPVYETLNIIDALSAPIDGVDVRISTDSGGDNTIQSGFTDALGDVTFRLDVGSYYVHLQKAGINFLTNPQTLTVS